MKIRRVVSPDAPCYRHGGVNFWLREADANHLLLRFLEPLREVKLVTWHFEKANEMSR